MWWFTWSPWKRIEKGGFEHVSNPPFVETFELIQSYSDSGFFSAGVEASSFRISNFDFISLMK